jgi:WD40 repeat protein
LSDWPIFLDFITHDELLMVDSSGKVFTHKYRASGGLTMLRDLSVRTTAVARATTTSRGKAGHLAIAADDCVILYDLAQDSAARIAVPSDAAMRARVVALAAIDPKRTLISVLRTQGGQRESELFLLEDGRLTATGTVMPAAVGVLSVLSNGKVICGRDDGIVSLWDRRSGRLFHQRFSGVKNAKIRCVAEARALGVVLMAGSFGVHYPIQVWDLNPWVRRDPRSWIAGHLDQISTMAVLPDGRTLVSAGRDCMLRFWHIEGRIALGAIRALPDWVTTLAVSPDGNVVATGGSRDRLVRTWGSAPHHYAQVDWAAEPDAHYSDPAIDYMKALLPALRPSGIPMDALRGVGLEVGDEQDRDKQPQRDDLPDDDDDAADEPDD